MHDVWVLLVGILFGGACATAVIVAWAHWGDS